MRFLVLSVLFWLAVASLARGVSSTSVYTSAPDDPAAQVFDATACPRTPEGWRDVTVALPGAINTLKRQRHFGVILLPAAY